MDKDDTERRLKDEARNALEAAVYSIPEFVSDDHIISVSTEKERQAITDGYFIVNL